MLMTRGRRPHLAPDTRIQNRRVVQDPSGNCGVIHPESAFGHHFLKIAIAQWIAEIPAHPKDDDLVPEMSSTEQHRPALAHSLHRTRRTPFLFATLPFFLPLKW
jgi:hypothetical protein